MLVQLVEQALTLPHLAQLVEQATTLPLRDPSQMMSLFTGDKAWDKQLQGFITAVKSVIITVTYK